MAELLIVDDEAPSRRALRRTLERSGHRVLEAGTVHEAREVLADQPVELVLCDVNMPGGSGLELVRSVVADAADTAIVMLTGVDDPEVADEALAIGAYGYLVKPVGGNEARIIVASSLRRRELELARRRYVDELESKVVSRSAALREALERLELSQATARDAERDAVDRLVAALTIRSEETGAHIRRVGRFAALLARLAGVRLWGEDEIPIAGRIAAIADVFDALTSDRVYRRALPFPDALAEMREQSGRQFDPALLDRFLGATGELEAIRAAHPDPSDL